MAASRFPNELLNGSVEEKAQYFHSIISQHESFNKVTNDVMEGLLDPGEEIIIVLGPPGVGKTALAEKLYARILRENSPGMENDPGFIPAIHFEAPAPLKGSFDNIQFFRRILSEGKDILIDKKTPNIEIMRLRTGNQKQYTRNFIYQEAAIDCIKNRCMKCILVDEGAHLITTTSAPNLIQQVDVLKQLTNQSKAKIVLFGPYSLLAIGRLNGQLERRVKFIHFPRYTPRYEEYLEFVNVVNTLQHHLPVPQMPELYSSGEYLFEMSLGCVGRLKAWLRKALIKGASENKTTITKKILEETAGPPSKLSEAINEILKGEEDYQDLFIKPEKLSKFSYKTKNTANITESADSEAQDLSNHQPQKPRRKTYPGNRRPKRDTVGHPELQPEEKN